MTTDFASIMDKLYSDINAKGAGWSAEDAAPYMNETCLYNGKPYNRAEIAANTASAFNKGYNIKFDFETVSVEQDAGKTDDGKTKQKLVGNLTVAVLGADGKPMEGVPQKKQELTYVWVDGKVVESFGPEMGGEKAAEA